MANEKIKSTETQKISGAMSSEEWYDLLPIKKKLILSSLSLGIALLVIFIFAFGVFHH
jgi:hypothetical protein